MQLGDPEPIRILDHHHGRVRDVDTNFDDSGGDKNLEFPATEGRHRGFLLLGRQLAVEQTDCEAGQLSG